MPPEAEGADRTSKVGAVNRRLGLLIGVAVMALALGVGSLGLQPGQARSGVSTTETASAPPPGVCALTAPVCKPLSPLAPPGVLVSAGLAVFVMASGLSLLQVRLLQRRVASGRLRSGVRSSVMRPPRAIVGLL
jgi:hypothetical protein